MSAFPRTRGLLCIPAPDVFWSSMCSVLPQLYYQAVWLSRGPLSSIILEPDSDLLYTPALNQTVAISRMIDASMKQRWVRLTSCTLHFREESNYACQLSPLVIGKPYLALQREAGGGRLDGGQNAVRLCSACEFSGCCARHPALCTNRSANMMY